MNSSPNSRPRSPSAHLLAVLVALMGAGPLFVLSLSSSSALVVERLDISAGQLGLIAAIVFGSAALVARPLGRWADTIPPQWQLVFNFGGAAAALLIAAVTANYLLICVAAVLAGASQAVSNPTTNRLIFEAVTPAKRASWLGLKQSGVPLAQLFGGIFFPVMAVGIGWAGAAAAGALLIVLLIVYGLWVLNRHYTPDQGAAPPPAAQQNTTSQQRSALSTTAESQPEPGKHSVVALLTVIAFLAAFSLQSLNVYIPLFAVDQMGFTLIQGGLTITVSGVVGMIARVWWARRVGAGARPSTLLIAIVLGSMLSVGFLLAAQLGGPSVLVWMAVLLHGSTALGTNVIINAGVMRAAPPGQIGRASGAAAMGMYAGFSLGPLTIGWLRDTGTDFSLSWAVALGVYLLALPIVLLLRTRGSSPGGEARRW